MVAGNTHHKSSVALILIDVINHFEFPDGESVLRNALPIVSAITAAEASRARCELKTMPAPNSTTPKTSHAIE